MNRNRKKAAVDTCLFLELFLEERTRFAHGVADLLENPEFELHVPTIVGVEAITSVSMRQGAERPPIKNAAIDAAKKFFRELNCIYIELDKRAMETAQELGVQYAIKPPDAAVLACAIEAECDYLFTKDDKLIKRVRGIKNIRVCHPPEPRGKQLSLDDRFHE